MLIKRAVKNDIGILAELAGLMWKDSTSDELKEEFSELVKRCVFFIVFEDNEAVGFAQCQLRCDYVEGTDSSPVGYLEGIFVREEYRGRGYAKNLLKQCEKWSSENGCKEFASDCELNNNISLEFHLREGFTETNRIICFTKKLNEENLYVKQL